MRYRRSWFPALLAAVSLTMAAGCSGSGGSAQAQGGLEKTNLTVAVVPTTDSTGFYIALHDNLFAQQGLHVNYVPAISAENVINQEALGKIDVVGGNYVSDIEAQNNYDRGVRATDVLNPTASQIAANLDVFAEASVMQPDFVGLFTPPGSPITKVSDLKNKTIGINAPGNVAYLLVASFLKQEGMSPNSVRFKYFPFPLMTQALMTHKVDVAFLAEPFISIAEEAVGVAELTNLDQGASQDFPIQGYSVTKEFAARYPHTLAAFKRALEQGQQIADTDRAAAEQATAAFKATDGVTPQIAAVVTFESYPLGTVDAVRLQRVASDMRQFGLLSTSFNVHQIVGS
jgi:NitT/TauT family transport system substrate-binding protein